MWYDAGSKCHAPCCSAWAESTCASYSSDLLVFHVYCVSRLIPVPISFWTTSESFTDLVILISTPSSIPACCTLPSIFWVYLNRSRHLLSISRVARSVREFARSRTLHIRGILDTFPSPPFVISRFIATLPCPASFATHLDTLPASTTRFDPLWLIYKLSCTLSIDHHNSLNLQALSGPTRFVY